MARFRVIEFRQVVNVFEVEADDRKVAIEYVKGFLISGGKKKLGGIKHTKSTLINADYQTENLTLKKERKN